MFAQVFESGFWHCVMEIKDTKGEARKKKKKLLNNIFILGSSHCLHGFYLGYFWGEGMKCKVGCCWQAAYEC